MILPDSAAAPFGQQPVDQSAMLGMNECRLTNLGREQLTKP